MRIRTVRIGMLAAVVAAAGASAAALASTASSQQLNGTVRALAWQSGYLYAGGDFTNAGGIAAGDYVARWAGSWSAACGGLNNHVNALETGPVLRSKKGNRQRPTNIYAGRALDLEHCTGSAWTALGNPSSQGTVNVILRVGTSVYVGGDFTNWAGISAADYIAKWGPGGWSAVGGGVNDIVYTLAWRNGSLYVGGEFRNAGGIAAADRVARWDGSSWSALGGGLNGAPHALVFRGSRLYAGGTFHDAGGVTAADKIAMWNGSSWSALGTGVNSIVYALAVRGSTVYAGGKFTGAGGVANADRVAAWSTSANQWATVCGGIAGGSSDTVFALLPRGAHDLYVGGRFTNAGGVAAADNVARCNGVAWSGL